MANNKYRYAAGGIIVLLIAVVVIYFVGKSVSNSSSSSLYAKGSTPVPISLTDPPDVPTGTSALVVTYSSVGVDVSGAGSSSGWIYSNTSGSVDLMSLVNVSQAIATVNVPANATINAVRFDATSATITINGTTSNVTVPSSYITAVVPSSARINSSSAILVDFSPSIVSIYSTNSTIFVLVPSVKAVVVGNSSVAVVIGHRQNINAQIRSRIMGNGNVNITGAALASTNGNTSMSITVKNNGNSSIRLTDVLLEGSRHVEIAAPLSARLGINESTVAQINNNLGGGAGLGIGIGGGIGTHVPPQVPPTMRKSVIIVANTLNNVNMSPNSLVSANVSINSSVNATAGMNQSSGVGTGYNVGANESAQGNAGATTVAGSVYARGRSFVLANIRNVISLGYMPFAVNSNGSLSVATGVGQLSGTTGYTLAPGATATLTFNGNIVVGNGSFAVSLVSGKPYKLVVVGRGNYTVVKATATVTAG